MTIQMASTRFDALVHARYEYRRLAVRTYAVAPGSDREYVALSAASWDQRLNELDAATTPLSDDEARVIDHLTATISDPRLSTAALVGWIDAFPTAIADLFSTSSLELRGDFDTDVDWIELPIDPTDAPVEAPSEATAAANKQPALALAA